MCSFVLQANIGRGNAENEYRIFTLILKVGDFIKMHKMKLIHRTKFDKYILIYYNIAKVT